MRADGTHLKRLTHNRGEDTDPDWSADGRRIIFQSNRNQPEAYDAYELYSIRPRGTCLTWLTNGTPASDSPDWEKDSSASSDPGACGGTHRRPLVETDLRPARRSDLAAFWLGKRFRSHLLTEVRARPGGREVGLGYDDCGLFSPRLCEPPLHLSERSVCVAPGTVAALAERRRIRERRGVLVALGRGDVIALSGGSVINVSLETSPRGVALAGELQALRGLRRLSRTRPQPTLPRTRLRVALLRELRKAERVHRRSGGLARVAEALKVSRPEARAVLRLARAVDRYGHVGKVHCRQQRATAKYAPIAQRDGSDGLSRLSASTPIPTPEALARFARLKLGVGYAPRSGRSG
jgi:WD40-like Beta Propeller Repeat